MAKKGEVERTHPRLWEQIKEKWHQGDKGGQAGKWNARKAQLAVQEYKRESEKKYGDNGYKGSKPKQNSLKKWTDEDWGYAGKEGESRYLPKAVRDRLTPAEKRRENRRKKDRLGEWVPYSDSVRQKMKDAGIF